VIRGVDKIVVSISVLVSIFLISCQKNNEEGFILLTPYQLIITDVHPSDVVSLVVDCQSPNELKQFTITSRIEGDYSKKELDTTIGGKKFYLRYEYKVPNVIKSTQIILEFTLRDVLGEVVSNAKIIDVIATSKYLQETAGHELFSGKSGKQNAYNIVEGIPLYSNLADSMKMHIADTSNNTVLLKRWISPAGVKFVKFNGFDYANCTNVSIKEAFNAGIKTEFVDNITIGDVFLARINQTTQTEAYVAIKIVNIIDATGSEWDRYVFNLKK
jgi:hypothetical protein